MPELPEVETVRRGLDRYTLDRAITGTEVLLPRTIAHPETPQEFSFGLQHTKIQGWHRRGKYLYAQLVSTKTPEAAGWLGVHLRMTGQLLWVESHTELHKHTRVRLFLGKDREIRFVDQRTFGQMWWIPPSKQLEQVMTGIAKLGPEPFDLAFSTGYFAAKLQKSSRNIKTVILDQNLVAGVGNIYADEALFMSKIHPNTSANQLTIDRVELLRASIIAVLQLSIEQGGTTFSNYLSVQGTNGNYGGMAWVYNRTKQPCRVCGTPIEKIRLGGRGTHYCPTCQSHDLPTS
ncbi:DNA-formamidopyrimidine glycosylase [Chamaesiphon sp. OTE_8_metabat_110]|uniref:DNA-formamidopyrimidine glycosylase n=1 Tax=Chamaesiphon sp. OTE_8_metabat_110 TaxID=2964696 RepID=UPI00286A3DAE|nr:DNA-formamidopyrimidine glycosylase [Chamaesiphon sp. OTE_8_metabat_110]